MPGEYHVELFIAAKFEEMVAAPETEVMRQLNACAGPQPVVNLPSGNVSVSVRPVPKLAAYDMWIEQVDTGKPWDFKNDVAKKYGKGQPVKVGPRQFSQDVVANI